MTDQQPSRLFHGPCPTGKPGSNMNRTVASAASSLPPAAKLQKPYPATAGSASARAQVWTGLAVAAPQFPS